MLIHQINRKSIREDLRISWRDTRGRLVSSIFGAGFAEKFELEVWIAERGSEYRVERQGQCQRISAEIRNAENRATQEDKEATRLRSH